MILFHAGARRDLRDATDWYRSESAELAERFIEELNRAAERVLRDPESWPRLGQRHRSISFRTFPYYLVYRIESDQTVFVVAVHHTSRRPGYWRNRLS